MRGEPIPILLYHSIDTEAAPRYRRWTVTPGRFAQHLAALVGNGYRPITFGHLAAGIEGSRALPARPVVITFDDGFRDFLTGAFPILQRFAAPATLFVVTDAVGGTARWLEPLGEGDRKMLSWDELAALAEGGIEVGAHTRTHPQLDVLPKDAAFSEIAGSKQALEARLGIPVETFAYPHGYASSATLRLARNAGFTAACRVADRMASTAEDRFALSRFIVTEEMDGEDILRLLASPARGQTPAARFAATGWRAARRLQHWARPFAARLAVQGSTGRSE